MKKSLLAFLCVLALACGTALPPQTQSPVDAPPTPLETTAPQVAILTVIVDGPDCGRSSVTVGPRSWATRPDCSIVEEFAAGDVLGVTASAPGFVANGPLGVTMTPGRMAPIRITLERVPVIGRRGAVRLERHAFADDGGVYLADGTSLFWALWGEKFDAERLDRNLAFAASNGVDYIRILGMVGAPSWEDRTIEPRWPDYWEVAARLFTRAARHGIRLQVTLFADAQVMMPREADREQWVDRWAAFANQRRERMQLFETANEPWQNGFADDYAQLRRLTKRLNDQTAIPVAPGAMACGTIPEELVDEAGRACFDEWRSLAEVSDLMTPHFDRDVSKADGYDRPVRQPWEMLFQARAAGAEAYVNNEPIGPQSSVAADDDPGRLAMAAAVTWLTQGAGYTLHTGAGIRGGGAADLARGRAANLWEVPHVEEAWRLINRAQALLPAGLPNCRPANAHWAEAPLSVDPDSLVRAYQSVCDDGTFVVLPHGIRGASVDLVARRDLWVGDRPLRSGDRLAVPRPSAVIVGRIR